MPTVNLSPVGNGFQFFNNDGLPLNAGKIYTYQAGSTTPLATYTDSSGLIANTNPIILGTDGRPPSTIWLTEGFFYKFVLKDSSDVTIQTYDNLYGIIGAAPPAATPIPAGGILIWSGSIGSIPAGYVLCNGNNGTPDLRDRFVVCAGNGYAVGATGGQTDATLVAHTHTINDPGHSHVQNGWTANLGGNQYGFADAGSFYDGVDGVSTQGTQTAITINSAGSSGVGANMPPYYALCYIMKT